MNTTVNKAVVALLGSIVTLVSMFGVNVDWASPELIGAIGSIITAGLVYLVPNKKEE